MVAACLRGWDSVLKADIEKSAASMASTRRRKASGYAITTFPAGSL
jgi:hypothetical protein